MMVRVSNSPRSLYTGYSPNPNARRSMMEGTFRPLNFPLESSTPGLMRRWAALDRQRRNRAEDPDELRERKTLRVPSRAVLHFFLLPLLAGLLVTLPGTARRDSM